MNFVTPHDVNVINIINTFDFVDPEDLKRTNTYIPLRYLIPGLIIPFFGWFALFILREHYLEEQSKANSLLCITRNFYGITTAPTEKIKILSEVMMTTEVRQEFYLLERAKLRILTGEFNKAFRDIQLANDCHDFSFSSVRAPNVISKTNRDKDCISGYIHKSYSSAKAALLAAVILTQLGNVEEAYDAYNQASAEPGLVNWRKCQVELLPKIKEHPSLRGCQILQDEQKATLTWSSVTTQTT